MEFTLSLVALNLGTVIVIVLATLFFGGILFLASRSRIQPAENQSAGVVAASKVTPIKSSVRSVKPDEGANQAQSAAQLRYDKGGKKPRQSSQT